MAKNKIKTKYIIGAFVATAFLLSNCSNDVEDTDINETANETVGERLTDDNGNEYTLIDNGDGTETAKYDDGRSVTFQRQDDGSLEYLAGAAGLIAGMAAGYYLFHGYSNTGTWDSARNRYTVSEPLKRDDKNTTVGTGAIGRTSNSKVNLSKTPTTTTTPAVTSNSSAKSGFGTAGARGSSAS